MSITFPSIFPVTCHTNYVGKGSTFVAIKGYNEDGVRYIPQAIEQGATTIAVERDVALPQATLHLIEHHGITLSRVANCRQALAQLSAQALGYPARKLKILGITGTKGKTTSAFLLEHMMKAAGYKTALISTVYNRILDEQLPMQLTTPQPDYLHLFFDQCVKAGVEYVIMEVAAQALSLHRVEGIQFDGIIFTNVDKEHAEFYATFDEYVAAKATIFNYAKSDAPIVVNIDNAAAAQFEHRANVCALSMQQDAIASIAISDTSYQAVSFSLSWHGNNPTTFLFPSLIGTFNVYNAAGVITLASLLGVDYSLLKQAARTFERVPGRLEGYALPNGARCYIDYAHNPSSYEAVLSELRLLTHHLIVLFGCGGNRDKEKRPLMGEIAARYADVVLLTSDNPRSESAQDIIADIERGIGTAYKNKVLKEVDREQAIKLAYMQAKKDSIIVLLGKGPDEYQQIGTIKYPFSEATIIKGLR